VDRYKQDTVDTTKGGNRFNGFGATGSGVPADQLGRVPNGNSSSACCTAGAPRVFTIQRTFLRRASLFLLAVQSDRTAIRGGFGIFYDKPEGNSYTPAECATISTGGSFVNANCQTLPVFSASTRPCRTLTLSIPLESCPHHELQSGRAARDAACILFEVS